MFEFLDVFSTVLASSGFGAIVGGLFGWLNRREDRKTRAEDQKHQLDMVSANANADQLTSEARAFEESQKADPSLGGMIKSAFRPIVTAVLMYMVYQILMELQDINGGLSVFPPEQLAQMYRDIVLNIICLASTAVNWWFASRPTAITKR